MDTISETTRLRKNNSPPSRRLSEKSHTPGRFTAVRSACETCTIKKLKCDSARPCQSCNKRGVDCKDKPFRRLACLPCRSRKIKCDLEQPCDNCIKGNRECSQAYGLVSSQGTRPQQPTSPIMPTPPTIDPPPTLESLGYAQTYLSPDTIDLFNIEEWNIDPFPSMVPFWPDPLTSPATVIPSPPDNHLQSIQFDTFDRSRLVHDLKEVPEELKGELPSSGELTVILRQYFQYVDALLPVFHLPSFSVKTCPSLMLLILLATGDVYSDHQTVEVWARKSFRYLVQKEIRKFDTGEGQLSPAVIRSLSMWVSELLFHGEPEDLLLAMHYRVIIYQACQILQHEDETDHPVDSNDETAWIHWIRTETRRRTVLSAYLQDTSLTVCTGLPGVQKLSELSIPLPEADALWYADSYDSWSEIRRREIGVVGDSNMTFPQLLSALFQSRYDLLYDCTGVICRNAIVVGLQEIILTARKLRNVNNNASLLKDCREGLEAWKASLQKIEKTATKAQYNAIMSSWCWAELLLTAPDFVIGMVYRVSASNSLSSLRDSFVDQVKKSLRTMDSESFNNLITAAAASIFHVESISESISLDECISSMRQTVYPNVTTSIFAGGLTLWVSIMALKTVERFVPIVRNEILPRLLSAMSKIHWLSDPVQDGTITITSLLGDLLMRTNVWSSFSIRL